MSIKYIFENYLISNHNKVKFSSKDIKKGDVFLALKGKNFHGNKFIKSSFKKGARFCVTDNDDYDYNEKIIYTKNIYQYLTDLAKRKRGVYKGEVVGITGSAGKTTLKETLAFFLKKNNTISYSLKSYNNNLGILVSLLNLNLKSSFSIFELGTNNFGEIKYLTNIVQPTQIIITNIQSTHLENFKTKNNIAKEKSDIFISTYNKKRKILYLNVDSKPEKIILNKAKRQKNLKIVRIDKFSNNYFIKNISPKNNYYKVVFSINRKEILLNTKSPIKFRLNNLLFCYAFFNENSLDIKNIIKQQKNLKPVDGRGLTHNITINNKKTTIIDDSYNANPDTMIQSVDYFANIKKNHNKKILILGNMNELGRDTHKMHINLLNKIDNYNFKFIILCGEFFKRSIKKLNNPKNEFIYIESKNKIMNYLSKFVHNNDTILIKCSNSTEINKFTKLLLKKVI